MHRPSLVSHKSTNIYVASQFKEDGRRAASNDARSVCGKTDKPRACALAPRGHHPALLRQKLHHVVEVVARDLKLLRNLRHRTGLLLLMRCRGAQVHQHTKAKVGEAGELHGGARGGVLEHTARVSLAVWTFGSRPCKRLEQEARIRPREDAAFDGLVRSLKTQHSRRKSLLEGAFLTKVRPELHRQAMLLRSNTVAPKHGWTT